MSQPIAGALHIQVNGEPRAARPGMTVADLLQELDVRADRVAVELNLQILDRQEFTRRGLNEGDRVEIISFIGGGACHSDECRVMNDEFQIRPFSIHHSAFSVWLWSLS